jgi:N-acetylglucosaminyldiphosphoundecaprenol N-acetyl-beta-D-mannosaminyltransferase
MGALALLLISPLLLLLYLAVKITSPGPFLFQQQRPGYRGQRFTIFKIRTMHVGSEKTTRLGVTQRHSGITPIGRLLRELKLDELPQLWNVARGDMELVGPRPLPVALHEELSGKIRRFDRRYDVRPGLSNVSQVAVLDNAVGEELIADWTLRLEGELHYVRNKSFAYDVLVLAMTTLFVVRKAIGSRTRPEAPATLGAEAPSTLVAGVPVSNIDYSEVVERIGGWIQDRKNRYVCVCPVHSIVEAHRRPEFRKVLRESALNTADGMPVVWAQRLFGHRHASRVYGPTLMLHTLERAEREGWRIALYGGRADRLEELTRRLKARFPDLQLVSAISPPFRELSEEEQDSLVGQINAARADIVWVGLGCPKQEQWMASQRHKVQGVMVGVGAAFDFHAGALRQAPPVLQKMGLEWLFRLACEPRRLFRRYASTNPLYIALIARQWLGGVFRGTRFQVQPDGPRDVSHERSGAAS